MRILIITQYFPPEIEAGGFRMYDFGQRLVAKGHEICILTGMPNFPMGIKPKGYRYKLFRYEYTKGLHIFRSYVYPTKNTGLFKRLVNYFSFAVSSIIASVMIPKVDVVICTSPPLFSGIPGLVISKLRGVPFVFDVRDIWPKAAIGLGLITNPSVIKLLEKLEECLYRHADRVVVVTSGYGDSISQKGISVDKIAHISNGVDTELIKAGEKQNRVRKELGIEGKFIALYAGTHGVSQGLQTLLEAARTLEIHKDIVFILIGEGAEKDALKQQAAKEKLGNILFLDQVPKSEIVDYLVAADICVVLLRKLDIFLETVPSKIYEFMAAEKPIVLGVYGEAEKILKEAQAGISFEPENADELVEAIMKVKSDPELMKQFGRNGRIAAEQKFSRHVLARKYEKTIYQLVGKKETVKWAER